MFGDVQVRRGDVPGSRMRIASYSGTLASIRLQREAEIIAGSVRLEPG
jgi:hypothetical protein